MAHDPNRIFFDDVGEHSQIEDVLLNAVERTWSPRTVPMPAQVDRIHVIVVTQCPGDPVPTPRMIARAVYQQHHWLAIVAPVPKLQLQPI